MTPPSPSLMRETFKSDCSLPPLSLTWLNLQSSISPDDYQDLSRRFFGGTPLMWAEEAVAAHQRGSLVVKGCGLPPPPPTMCIYMATFDVKLRKAEIC